MGCSAPDPRAPVAWNRAARDDDIAHGGHSEWSAAEASQVSGTCDGRKPEGAAGGEAAGSGTAAATRGVEARHWLERAVSLRPDGGMEALQLGVHLERVREFPAAREALRRATRHCPASPRAWAQYASALAASCAAPPYDARGSSACGSEQGAGPALWAKEAQAAVRRAEALGGGAEEQVLVARVLGALADPEASVAALRRAASLDPTAQAVLGRSLLEQGRAKEARGALRRAARLGGLGAPAALVLLAQAEVELGKRQAAERHLQQALQLNPNSVPALAAAALLFKENRDYAPARAALETARRLEPSNAMLLVNLGKLSEEDDIGDWESALDCYRDALAADPLCQPALLARARLYEDEVLDLDAAQDDLAAAAAPGCRPPLARPHPSVRSLCPAAITSSRDAPRAFAETPSWLPRPFPTPRRSAGSASTTPPPQQQCSAAPWPSFQRTRFRSARAPRY